MPCLSTMSLKKFPFASIALCKNFSHLPNNPSVQERNWFLLSLYKAWKGTGAPAFLGTLCLSAAVIRTNLSCYTLPQSRYATPPQAKSSQAKQPDMQSFQAMSQAKPFPSLSRFFRCFVTARKLKHLSQYTWNFLRFFLVQEVKTIFRTIQKCY